MILARSHAIAACLSKLWIGTRRPSSHILESWVHSDLTPAQAPGFARTSVGAVAVAVTTVYDGALPIFASDMHGRTIDDVLVTHLHPDHASGLLTADGEAAFPSATVHLSTLDVEHWPNDVVAASAKGVQAQIHRWNVQALAPLMLRCVRLGVMVTG